jgi:hypothetical protein
VAVGFLSMPKSLKFSTDTALRDIQDLMVKASWNKREAAEELHINCSLIKSILEL